MKRSYFAVVFVITILISQTLWAETTRLAAPENLPNTVRQMKSPGFWVARHPFPDKVILDRSEIAAFNANIRKEDDLVVDPSGIGPVYPGDDLKKILELQIKEFRAKTLFNQSGGRISEVTFKKIQERMAIDLVYKKCIVKYGIVCAYSDQRKLPVEEIMIKEAGDKGFDELQNNSFDIGTPLAILHESSDGKWVYVTAPSSSGWIKKENVAFAGVDAVKRFENATPFIVVTSPKADIYLDGGLTAYYDFVRMGTTLPCYDKADRGVVMVRIPYKTDDGKLVEMKGFMKREDVNFGFREYTPRAIIEQAFKLLNAPYGWGGSSGEQDCSAFIQEIFSTVGINMPRNSAGQGEVGYLLAEFSDKSPGRVKLDTISREAVGAVTTLKMKGHIMLYLGMYAKEPYVIHATYGYGEKSILGDVDRVINKVVVSDLSLGSGGKKGSLLERISTIRLLSDKEIKGK
jgi:hypothetical protein